MKNIARALFAPLLLALALFNSTAAMAQMVNAQTGTTYTFLNTDCDPSGRKVITFNNAAAVAATLPQAGAAGQFASGCAITVENLGAGAVTITPATSTINALASIAIPQGASAVIFNDGTNYLASVGNAGASSLQANNFRNLLDNGGIAVQQRGTGTQTCGTTTIPATAYSGDRWGCNVNVTSGAGTLQVVNTGLPTGFSGSQLFYRTSGALLQPQCTMQEISTVNSTTLAGQTATLTFYAKALAAMVTDNGGVMNAYIFTGTGSDQGLQSFTASPAITPAWTGITSTLTKSFTLTTSFARYSYTAAIPSTATELAVALCWTPTSASGAGVTDGFTFTGVQLEPGAIPSPFEFRPYSIELAIANRYYAQWADAAATLYFPATCVEYTSGTVARCNWALPITMRTVPTPVINTATSFGMTKVADGTAEACTTFAVVASAANVNNVTLSCTVSETAAVGTMHLMIGGASGATNLLAVSADF